MWIFSDKEYSLSTENPSDISKRLLETIDSCWSFDYYCEWQINGIFNEWKRNFLSAWFDVDKEQVLPNFDAQKVKYLEDKLDETLEQVQLLLKKYSEKTKQRWKKIQELDNKEIKTPLKYIPILGLTLKTQTEDTTLLLRHLEGFNPQNRPGEKIDVKKLGLVWVLSNVPRLNLETTLLLDNPKTPENEWIKKLADYLENIYFKKHPDVLTSFWIKDIKHITPRQAVQLASYIPMERIKYSQVQVWDWTWSGSRNNTAEINDNAPIDKLFDWENDKSWNWVCRNYASVAIWVLEAVKMLQDEKTSLINNTYALDIWFNNYNWEPWFVFRHAWNWYINFTRDKSWKIIAEWLVLDSTWWDSDSLSSDPARVNNNEVKLDYTSERFFTLINKFEKSSLLPFEDYLPELLENYKRSPKLLFSQMEEDLFFPNRLFIWYNLINNFKNINKVSDYLKKVFEEFLILFLGDIEDYIKCFEKISIDYWQQKVVNITYFLLENLNQLFDTWDRFWIFQSQDKKTNDLFLKFQNITSSLSNQSWNYGFILGINDKYALLAAKLWDNKLLEEQLKLLKWKIDSNKAIWNNNDDYISKLKEIFNSISSDDWKEIFLKIFPDFKQETGKRDDTEIIIKRIEKKFNLTVRNLVFDNKKNWDIKKVLLDLEDILNSFSYWDFLNIKTYIHLNSKPWEVEISLINLDLSMTKEQIIEEIHRYKRHQDIIKQIKQSANCDLKIDYLRFSNNDEIEIFLQNAEKYFLQVPDNLVNYKLISISNSDEIENFIKPTIWKEHFIKWEFDKIDELLSTHDALKYNHLYNEFDIKKKFQNLWDEYPFLWDVIVAVENKNLWKVDSYYVELKNALNKFNGQSDNSVLWTKEIKIRIIDLESELYIYDYAKKLLEEWYSSELLKILNMYYAKQFVSPDGTIKAEKISLSRIFEIKEVSDINNISIFIWDTKTWNKVTDETRDRLRKAWNPIKITEIKKWILYSNWIEIHITKWDKIIPTVVKWKVTQDWVITLYSNNSQDEISKELLKQIERYKKFRDNLNKLKELLSSYTLVKPRYDFSTLNSSIEDTLERIIKILKDNTFQGFGMGLNFEIWESLVELKIKKYNTEIWRYEDNNTKIINFWNLTDKQIFLQIEEFLESMKKVDSFLDKIKKSYTVTIDMYYIREKDFSIKMNYLNKLEAFLKSWNYSSYKVSFENNIPYDKEYQKKQEGIYVNQVEKKIIIK